MTDLGSETDLHVWQRMIWDLKGPHAIAEPGGREALAELIRDLATAALGLLGHDVNVPELHDQPGHLLIGGCVEAVELGRQLVGGVEGKARNGQEPGWFSTLRSLHVHMPPKAYGRPFDAPSARTVRCRGRR